MDLVVTRSTIIYYLHCKDNLARTRRRLFGGLVVCIWICFGSRHLYDIIGRIYTGYLHYLTAIVVAGGVLVSCCPSTRNHVELKPSDVKDEGERKTS